MDLAIDPGADVPPFEQLRTRLVADITSGELAAGTRLPTVRTLAADLGIATNTVARAYRELETDGFIETRGRHGSFVSAQGDAAERQAQEAATAYVERVRHLGVDPAAALRFVERALGATRSP